MVLLGTTGCNSNTNAREQSFECIACGCRMHLTAKCTKLSNNAMSGKKELGMNILLLCNMCVSAKQQEKIRSLLAKPDPVKEEKLEKMENEMKEFKETVSEIRNILSKLAKQSKEKPIQKESN